MFSKRAYELICIKEEMRCLVAMVNMMQPMTPVNHIYLCDNRNRRNEECVLLCIADIPEVRAFANSLHLKTKLYFGDICNTDPSHTYKSHATLSN